MSNIKEVIEIYLEDENSEPVNHFIGFRELEFVTA